MHILKCMYMYMVNVICADQCFFFSARKYEQQQQPPKQTESVQLSVE